MTDDSFLSVNITTRQRRLYTFVRPIGLRLYVAAAGLGVVEPRDELVVLELAVGWAEGMEDDAAGDDGRFLVLDLVHGSTHIGKYVTVRPDPVVGVWVPLHNIASQQVQVPPRDPGSFNNTPRRR